MAELRELHHAAVAMLARREHSHQELLHKLSSKGHEAALCEQVLQELEAQGLLCDQRYAEAYVRMRANRGYGPVRIRHELREKGVSSIIATAELEQAEVDWLELAREVRKKRFGDAPPVDFAERAKQMRFLQYRGFSQEQINFATEGAE